MRDRLRLSRSGFTLVELLLAVGISSIILYALSQGVSSFMRRNLDSSRRMVNVSDQKAFAARFVSYVESAGISVQFQHLPILTNCGIASDALDRPCMQKLDPTTQKFTNVTAPLMPTTIEFFRDEEARIQVEPAYSGQEEPAQGPRPAQVSRLQRQRALSSDLLDPSWHTVWPLINESSPPFLLTSPANTLNQLHLDWSTIAPAAAAPGLPTDRLVQFTVLAPPVDAAQTQILNTELGAAKGGLMLLYNMDTPTHYMVQQLVDFSVVGAPGPATRVRLQLEPVTAHLTAFAQDKYFPPLGGPTGLLAPSAGSVVPSDLIWGGVDAYGSGLRSGQPKQAANFYPFITDFPSFTMVDDANFGPRTGFTPAQMGTIDIRSVAWAYRASRGQQPAIVALPIVVKAFSLAKADVPTECPDPTRAGFIPNHGPRGCPNTQPYKVMMTSYPDNRLKFSLLDMFTGKLIFARKLGSKTISVQTQ